MNKNAKAFLLFVVVVLVLGTGSYFLAKEYPDMVDFSFTEEVDQRSGD